MIIPKINELKINGTVQKIFVKNSMNMTDLKDESVHLMVTSPPYFDAKMYSKKPIEGDLGNIHNLNEWFEKISLVWREVLEYYNQGGKHL